MTTRTVLVFLLVCLLLIMPAAIAGDGVSSGYDTGGYDKIIQLSMHPVRNQMQYAGSTWDLISCEGCVYEYLTGSPRLPVKVMILTSNRSIENINVTLSNPVSIDQINIVPAGKPVSLTQEDILDQIEINYSAYSRDEFTPLTPYQLSLVDHSTRKGEQEWIYNLRIYPLSYNPVKGLGIFYQDAEIGIIYEDLGGVRALSSGSGDGESSFAPRALLPGPNVSSSGVVKYVVITSTDLSDELQPLVDWKTKKGVPAQIYNLTYIYTNFNGTEYNASDNQSKIKSFINWTYHNQSTEYVLLAGDTDVVPVRDCKDSNVDAGDDGKIPADTYYAALDGTWNVDNDSTFCEIGDLDDLTPDIYVGRIAISSEIPMSQWVNDTLEYEKNPPNGTWFNNVTIIGTNVFAVGDGHQRAEYLYDTYIKHIYSSFDKLYEDEGNVTDASETKDSINRGTANVVFLGHGSPTGWYRNLKNTLFFDTDDVNALNNNGKKPVIVALACSSSRFDDDTKSIGENFTEKDNGSIAYVGFSRTVHAYPPLSPGYEDTSAGLQEDFYRQMSNFSRYHLGEVFTHAKYYYSQWWSPYFNNPSSPIVQDDWLALNLLGDPELPMWTAVPQSFNVTYPASVEVGTEQLMVNVTNNSTGIVNATVCVQKDDELYEYNLTDANGNITFNVSSLATLGNISLTVTKHNYLPYEANVTVLNSADPSIDLITPTNGSSVNTKIVWFNITDITGVNVSSINVTINGSVSAAFNSTPNCSGTTLVSCNYTEANITEGQNNLSITVNDTLDKQNNTTITFTYDETEPQWHNLTGSNRTTDNITHKGESISFWANWTDNIQLERALLELNRTQAHTDDWENISTMTMSSNQSYSNFTLNQNLSNLTPGMIGWKIHGIDAAGNTNNTSISVFQLWAWSDVNITAPLDNSSHTRGKNISIQCEVTDANGSYPVGNYTVNFYNRSNSSNATNFTYMENATTNPSGMAVAYWDTAVNMSNREYYFKCNISDNTSLYYNTSVNQSTININLLAGTNVSEVNLSNTIPEQGDNITVRAKLVYDNGTPLAYQNISYNESTSGNNTTPIYIGSNSTNVLGWATILWSTTQVVEGNYMINVTYSGNDSIYTASVYNNSTQIYVECSREYVCGGPWTSCKDGWQDGTCTCPCYLGIGCGGDDKTTQPCISPSGGGGGGGTGVMLTPTPIALSIVEVETQSISTITPGSPATLSFSKTDISEITINVKSTVNNVKLEVAKLREKPSDIEDEPEGKSYGYIRINPSIHDSYLESATIKFKVKNSWMHSNSIDPDNVVLSRYKGSKWNKLDTSKISGDSQHTHYLSITPGFSVFAITGAEKKATPTPTETPTPTATPVITATPTPTPTPRGAPYTMLFGILLVAAVMAMAYVLWKRQKR